MQVDVLIIGGGVIGCAIARQLSRKNIRIALVEAKEDVSMGASRANSGIVHAGYDAVPGTLMAQMNVLGNALYDQWCQELQIPLSRIGSLVIALHSEDEAVLSHLYVQGIQNEVPGLSLIGGNAARTLEPLLSGEVTKALYAKTGAITCPYQFAIACYENALRNGVQTYLGTAVTAIEVNKNSFHVRCGDRCFDTTYIINAAGLFADDIAHMVGDESFSIHPRKGEYMLLDHAASHMTHTIFQTPSAMGKGVLVSPTVDGNVFAGPTATDQESRDDTETTAEGIAQLHRLALASVPTLDIRALITSFAGLRAHSNNQDFIIRPSEIVPHMIHVAGICSPGLSSAPAIADYVVALLADIGLQAEDKKDFSPIRHAIPRFAEMTREERVLAIQKNPRYGRVICRCETITEAEIVEAIRRGANSLDAVKRRTRSGMGRCQGGFCSPRVMEIIHRETHLPMTEITKFGGDSTLLVGELKEVL